MKQMMSTIVCRAWLDFKEGYWCYKANWRDNDLLSEVLDH